MCSSTEFEVFVQSQKHFLDELLEGRFLSDMSQEDKEFNKGMPNIDELRSFLEEED